MTADDCEDDLHQTLEELMAKEAEIERLRAALEELAVMGEQGMKPDYAEWLTFHDKVAQIARLALKG